MEIAERIARLLIEKADAAQAEKQAWENYCEAVEANPETSSKRKAWNDATVNTARLTGQIDELTKQMLGGSK